MKAINDQLLHIYNQILSYSSKKIAPYMLVLLSFSDCAFFIIIPDILLIPMCIANHKKSLFYAAITLVASILGSTLGYFLGSLFFNTYGKFLIHYFHYQEHFNTLKSYYHTYGSWIVFMATFLPIPYLLITLFSGFVKLNFIVFISMVAFSRGIRYFAPAILITYFGERSKTLIAKNITKISFTIVAITSIMLIYSLIK